MAQSQMTRPGMDATGRGYQPAPAPSTGEGWITFAGVMFLIASAFNAVYGIAALANDDYFAVDELLFGDLSMWGIFYLVVATVQMITAGLVLNRSSAGAFMGIVIAGLSAIVALVSIGAYPLWSVTILVVDALIIYGLSVYGFED